MWYAATIADMWRKHTMNKGGGSNDIAGEKDFLLTNHLPTHSGATKEVYRRVMEINTLLWLDKNADLKDSAILAEIESEELEEAIA
jgi:hypothetical protein